MFSMQVMAQLNMSSSYFQLSVYDEASEKWIILSDNVEELNFFEFNQSYTLLSQINSKATVNHLIHSSVHVEEKARVEFSTVTSTGRQYLVVLDDNQESLRFITEREGEVYMVKYSIKDAWIDGE